ncbi:MAG: ComF family protein [Pseudomonadota bacterium]
MLSRKISALLRQSQRVLARLAISVPCPCALCGIGAPEVMCKDCRRDFFGAQSRRCSQCATRLPETGNLDPHIAKPGARCGDCLHAPPAFDATLVAADYCAPVDQLVLGLKFGGRLALAPFFSTMLRDTILQSQSSLALPTLLAPVPLGRLRLAERGFNQALEIAKPLARALGVPLCPTLALRVRDTGAQALLHPDERRSNIRDGFTVTPQWLDQVKGQHIGIVDDVITTGETLNELAATLKRFGAARVTNFVFARTPQH